MHELWDRGQAYLAIEPARRPTDDVRVADAFALLDAQGLVARMKCGWDQGEASEECVALTRELRREGYASFHAQDAERLEGPDATLYLGFDAVPPRRHERFPSREEYDAAALAVGHRVAQAMVAHGLEVRWDVSPTARIQVVGPDSRRQPPPD